MARVTEGATPCAVAEAGDGWHVVLDPDALETCGGSVARFQERLLDALPELRRLPDGVAADPHQR